MLVWFLAVAFVQWMSLTEGRAVFTFINAAVKGKSGRGRESDSERVSSDEVSNLSMYQYSTHLFLISFLLVLDLSRRNLTRTNHCCAQGATEVVSLFV